MYEHHRLRLERALASARGALYRAEAVLEEADDLDGLDDLKMLNAEVARIMGSYMKRPQLFSTPVRNRQP